VKEWIEAANPTYPCLIDEKHIVAERFDMVNVPSAVWINEEGRIVRPAESAGWTDAWRTNNRSKLEQSKNDYFDAVRDWVHAGDSSKYVLSSDEVRQRKPGPTNEHALATANFRLGLYLTEQGYVDEAKQYFSTAIHLQPESWNFKRQAWWLVESKEEQRKNFLEALEGLGDRPYYPLIELKEK
jgi:tetratricopeptide (TPR) repeat protein